jgi:hypothetical protein
VNANVLRVLAEAGWTPEWDASAQAEQWINSLTDKFPLVPGILQVLRRYGGLRVRQGGAGRECARESFEIDPMLASGEGPRFSRFSRVLGRRLFPLGEAGSGHVFLALGDDGKVYALMHDLWRLADSIETALEVLVEGLRVQKLAEEDEAGAVHLTRGAADASDTDLDQTLR